jgi:hypothetical protein
MPKVGNKEFTYDAKGKAAAKKAAAKTGQPIEKMAGYKNGGKVKDARGPMA